MPTARRSSIVQPAAPVNTPAIRPAMARLCWTEHGRCGFQSLASVRFRLSSSTPCWSVPRVLASSGSKGWPVRALRVLVLPFRPSPARKSRHRLVGTESFPIAVSLWYTSSWPLRRSFPLGASSKDCPTDPPARLASCAATRGRRGRTRGEGVGGLSRAEERPRRWARGSCRRGHTAPSTVA